MAEKLTNGSNKKVRLDIFVPLSECACVYEHFINRVFTVIMKYIKLIEFETKSLDSEDAQKLDLHGNCVVLDNNKIVNETFQLQKELPNYLKAKGLI